ncbi:N-acetyl-D-glucosamine kinase Nagk [Arthrobacter crystallopoietes BAB-32]|uniref:N-acetyl-D-glucosamine kinase Nagk n=1 Tax=Arthrobacter crystallopoietes BAB-32 TaxID=1246476 RepID=N1UZP5_9MICC|nr:BadF/BadG/BcrA/BcrD ATPase family protein [Arthrobacter crystallopoietes]EMY34540.1 N-acetyl-D-glucosamine kinase Nagk [Arthrobacter crystallopoietes BAB-32]
MAEVLIGLDIGGSKTHAVRFEDGMPAAEAVAASANVQNVSRAEAAAALREVFAAVGAGARAVVAGAGGVDTADDAGALVSLIAPLAPGARIHVVHDSRLILAAGGARSGIAVIVGTGTAAWGTDGAGREARAGGWGYLLGDEGSGYWLAREAVRHALRRRDQGLAPDALTRALLADCGLAEPAELIAAFHGGAGRAYWAQRARLVIEAAEHGGAAAALVDDAVRHLSGLVLQVARQIGSAGPVILGGGIGTNVPRIAEGIAAAVAGAGIRGVRQLDRAPAFGAAFLAGIEPPAAGSVR